MKNKWIKAAKWASKQKCEVFSIWNDDVKEFSRYFASSDTCLASVFTKDHLILALLLMEEINK